MVTFFNGWIRKVPRPQWRNPYPDSRYPLDKEYPPLLPVTVNQMDQIPFYYYRNKVGLHIREALVDLYPEPTDPQYWVRSEYEYYESLRRWTLWELDEVDMLHPEDEDD